MLTLWALVASAEKQTTTLHIPDMECKNCQAKVEKTLAYEKGVKDLRFDLATRCVTVIYDDKKTDIAQLQAALIKYNKYESSVVSEGDTLPQCEHGHDHAGHGHAH